MCLPILKAFCGSNSSKYNKHSKQDLKSKVIQFNSRQDDIITSICGIDTDTFITGNIDGEIYCINWKQDKSQQIKNHSASITSLIYNDKQQYFMSGSRDKSIQLCHIQEIDKPKVEIISRSDLLRARGYKK